MSAAAAATAFDSQQEQQAIGDVLSGTAEADGDVTGGAGKTPEYVGYYYPTGTSLGPVEVGADSAEQDAPSLSTLFGTRPPGRSQSNSPAPVGANVSANGGAPYGLGLGALGRQRSLVEVFGSTAADDGSSGVGAEGAGGGIIGEAVLGSPRSSPPIRILNPDGTNNNSGGGGRPSSPYGGSQSPRSLLESTLRRTASQLSAGTGSRPGTPGTRDGISAGAGAGVVESGGAMEKGSDANGPNGDLSSTLQAVSLGVDGVAVAVAEAAAATGSVLPPPPPPPPPPSGPPPQLLIPAPLTQQQRYQQQQHQHHQQQQHSQGGFEAYAEEYYEGWNPQQSYPECYPESYPESYQRSYPDSYRDSYRDSYSDHGMLSGAYYNNHQQQGGGTQEGALWAISQQQQHVAMMAGGAYAAGAYGGTAMSMHPMGGYPPGGMHQQQAMVMQQQHMHMAAMMYAQQQGMGGGSGGGGRGFPASRTANPAGMSGLGMQGHGMHMEQIYAAAYYQRLAEGVGDAAASAMAAAAMGGYGGGGGES
mmetsp:Transcript_260/g.658  ORF Transcript_260/g.658 Transcript_260/m.658 type:complete len:532 (-) Transcript_260:7-1602(-)